MSQVALFDMISEHVEGDVLTHDVLRTIIGQLAQRKVNDSQRLGEQLEVTSTRLDETSALMIVSGTHTRHIYGELRLSGDVHDLVALDYALTIVLNGSVPIDKAQALLDHLRSSVYNPQGLDEAELAERHAERQELIADLAADIEGQLPPAIWMHQLLAEEMDELDIFDAFHRAMLRLRQLPIESQRINHPLNVTCRIDMLDRIEREVDGERVRSRGVQLVLSAKVAGNRTQFGHERLVVLIDQPDDEVKEALADLARLLAAQLQSVLNDHWLEPVNASFECHACTYETGNYLHMLDHTLAEHFDDVPRPIT